MTYLLRTYRDSDAEALTTISRAAIQQIGPKAYSPDQVEAWRARHSGPDRYRDRFAENDLILVAVDPAGHPVAYILLQRDGHLDHLYCHPEHTRRGLADRLLAEAEGAARTFGAKRLYTEASDIARAAFERAGYRATHRREFAIDGVPIHNWAMEKQLR